MRFLLLPIALLLFGCAAAEQSKPTYSLDEQAMVIDDVCLAVSEPKEEEFEMGDDEVYVTATKAPKEGEIFALSVGNEIEDTLRSLRKKEEFIDRKARFLGYDEE